MTLGEQTETGLDRSRFVFGVFLVSGGALLALALWKLLKGNNIDDDASQLCRLVSPRRSKDDDKRVQLKRRRGTRLRSPKSLAVSSDTHIFKRQNTI